MREVFFVFGSMIEYDSGNIGRMSRFSVRPTLFTVQLCTTHKNAPFVICVRVIMRITV